MAMDMIGLGLSVVQIANGIRDRIGDVKGFPDRSKRLSSRIDSLLPAVALLQDSIGAEDVQARQENEPIKLKVFHQALTELEQCVKGVKQFIDSLTKIDFFSKFTQTNAIKDQFDSYSERLDVLQSNIQFGILVELRRVIVTQDSNEGKTKRDDKWESTGSKRAEFERGRKEAFKNRRAVDSSDDKADEKKILSMLQEMKEDQKEVKITVKQLVLQIKELTDAQLKPAKPSGYDIEEMKTILTNELKNMTKMDEGSLGTVYSAKYMMEEVAVKRLKPNQRSNLTELNENLRKEAMNLKKFDSKHVVRLWGIVAETDNDPMIVFEYMNRGTLRRFLNSIKIEDFPWTRRRHLALGGVLGLYRIHNMQPPMLHCAIGSDKFLVNSNWEIKITDVGFAKTRTSAGKSRNKKKNLSTNYFAPEHLMDNKQKYDERSENYGFGIVMWEIATCKVPFKDMDPGQQTMYLMEKKMEPLPDDCPESFGSIINRCRSFDRMERPLTGEIVELLQKCEFADV